MWPFATWHWHKSPRWWINYEIFAKPETDECILNNTDYGTLTDMTKDHLDEIFAKLEADECILNDTDYGTLTDMTKDHLDP